MEDENSVESVEFLASNGKGEPHKDGMEDDTELENEDGCHLRRVSFRERLALIILEVAINVRSAVTKMIFTRRMAVICGVVHDWSGLCVSGVGVVAMTVLAKEE